MSTLTNIDTLIVCTPGICGGRPRIQGSRITVENIVIDYQAGMNPKDIITEKKHLTLAQVYAALAYYYTNQEVMDREIAAEEAQWKCWEAENNPGEQE